jgi:hypothetical protein
MKVVQHVLYDDSTAFPLSTAPTLYNAYLSSYRVVLPPFHKCQKPIAYANSFARIEKSIHCHIASMTRPKTPDQATSQSRYTKGDKVWVFLDSMV